MLEIVQAPLRQRFHHLFGDFDIDFQRDIFSIAKFIYLPNINHMDQFYDDFEDIMINRQNFTYN